MLQTEVIIAEPKHSNPPCAALTFLSLVLVTSPPPHGFEHSPITQSSHSQLTCNISSLSFLQILPSRQNYSINELYFYLDTLAHCSFLWWLNLQSNFFHHGLLLLFSSLSRILHPLHTLLSTCRFSICPIRNRLHMKWKSNCIFYVTFERLDHFTWDTLVGNESYTWAKIHAAHFCNGWSTTTRSTISISNFLVS